jgi:hypothetical protein
MSERNDALIRIVRLAIYNAIEATGTAPSSAEVARRHELDAGDVDAAYRALADGHVIVLEPGTLTIRWAPPFSLAATLFRVHRGRSSWFAPCAWDAFGIPAALECDARIDASCAWSGESIACGVEHDRAYGNGVIHLVVPAAHFWDDIVFT